MFLFCLRHNEYIVEVDGDLSRCDEVFENVVHHPLESGRWIGESEEHNRWLVQATISSEGRLPFVSCFDANIIVSPPNVQFRKVFGAPTVYP